MRVSVRMRVREGEDEDEGEVEGGVWGGVRWGSVGQLQLGVGVNSGVDGFFH